MSSSGQGGSGGGEDQGNPKGIKKFMRRASLVLKRDKTKRQSVSEPSAFAPVKETGAPAEPSGAAPKTSGPTETAAGSQNPPAASIPAGITQTIRENKPVPTPIKPRSAMNAKEYSAIQEEKARMLFAKYGLTLEAGEWTRPETTGVPRIEKKVRLRIHRTCHRCQTGFGADRVCSNCSHSRCKKCPGYPNAKTKVPKGKGLAATGISTDDGTKEGAATVAKPEMTRKVPTQRIRYTCHECSTLFKGKAAQCESCNHWRCVICPREPPKKDKPTGDTSITIQAIIWVCEGCDSKSPDRAKFCSNCGHKKCDNCSRIKPGQVSRPPDEGVASAEARMKDLAVSPQAQAA